MVDTFANSLLVPPLRQSDSAQAAERALDYRVNNLPVQAVLVYDFGSVSKSALPILAEQFNLLGDAGWDFAGFGPSTEQKKRNLLKEAVALHRVKGTRYALQRALDLLGISAYITEWWQPNPPYVRQSAPRLPHTFAIDLHLRDANKGEPVLTPKRIQALLRVVHFWKPARSQFSVRFGVGIKATMRTATTVRPAQAARLRVVPVVKHLFIPKPRTATTVRPLVRTHMYLLPTGATT